MRTIFRVPVIPADQYDAFRRTVGPDLADTYDEWAKRFVETRKQHWQRNETVVEVEVKHDQFIAFCNATGTKPDIKRLLDFAIESSGGQNK